jgi:serine/threonine protein kinase
MIAAGDRLDDKYRVTRRLGGGGFGDVFLAEEEVIPGRKVAIKVLSRPGDDANSDLLREMRALLKFQHPHVVAFHHHFRDDIRHYLVMEFCPVGSLADRLRVAGSLPTDQVLNWGLELCETLAFVHAREIVHHDIKPHTLAAVPVGGRLR